MSTVKKPWIRTAGVFSALLLAGSLTLSACNQTGAEDGDGEDTSEVQNDSGDSQNDSGDDEDGSDDDSGDD